MYKLISLRTFIAGIITTAFLAGCNQTYPKWYYQAQLSGLESDSCRQALEQTGGKKVTLPEICDVTVTNAIITHPEYRKTETPLEIRTVESADILTNRAYEALKADRYEDAILSYSKAILLDPSDEYSFYNRGVAYTKLKLHDEAIADYTRTIALSPTFEQAYNNRGVAFMNRDQFNKAASDFLSASNINPLDAKHRSNAGLAYGRLKEREKAIEQYNHAISLNPKQPNYLYFRSKELTALKRFHEAITDLKKAISLNPNDYRYYWQISIAYRKIYDVDNANENCARANELHHETIRC